MERETAPDVQEVRRVLADILAEAGVRFVVVEWLPGMKVDRSGISGGIVTQSRF